MAITNKEEGVWSIDQVYAKQNQGSIWDYSEGFNLFSTGQNSIQNFSSPTQIPGSWVAISSGSQIGAVTGIKDDGTMWSWGQNEYGQL